MTKEKMAREQVIKVIAKARKEGRRADLSRTDLSGANLFGVDLSRADLSGANLSGASLFGADLSRANLSGANLSGVKGRLSQSEWMKENFEKTNEGYIVYKAVGKTEYTTPKEWKEEPGAIWEEVCNPDRSNDCACGVNFATKEWIIKWYEGKLIDREVRVWKCLIEPDWFFGVIVPFGTNGKARCEKLRLIEQIEI